MPVYQWLYLCQYNPEYWGFHDWRKIRLQFNFYYN